MVNPCAPARAFCPPNCSGEPPVIKICDFGFAKTWSEEANMFTQIGWGRGFTSLQCTSPTEQFPSQRGSCTLVAGACCLGRPCWAGWAGAGQAGEGLWQATRGSLSLPLSRSPPTVLGVPRCRTPVYMSPELINSKNGKVGWPVAGRPSWRRRRGCPSPRPRPHRLTGPRAWGGPLVSCSQPA